MKTSIEIIVEHDAAVPVADIGERLYRGCKGRVPKVKVLGFRIGASVARRSDPMPGPALSDPITVDAVDQYIRVQDDFKAGRCGGDEGLALLNLAACIGERLVAVRRAELVGRGECSGPLPGRDVTVVQTPDKTLFVRRKPLDCQGPALADGKGKVSLP